MRRPGEGVRRERWRLPGEPVQAGQNAAHESNGFRMRFGRIGHPQTVSTTRGQASAWPDASRRPEVVPLRGIDALLGRARAGLRRLTPVEAVAAIADGALLIDTRTLEQRTEQGDLPGAICIDRTVLEWRLAPDSAHRIPEARDPRRTIIVVCRQGFSSSLAAASLQAAGLPGATDMIGGFEAWVAAGLPLSDAPADVRR